jgi:hypothetical protein
MASPSKLDQRPMPKPLHGPHTSCSVREIRPIQLGQPRADSMVAAATVRQETKCLIQAYRYARVFLMNKKNPNPHAVALGKLGGLARSKKLSPAQRTEIARKAGRARSQKLSPEERKRLAAMGGRASAGIPKTKRKEKP